MVGWLASLNRTVYVKRENRLGVAEQINELRDALAENWAITVFPEGTTTDGKSLLPFKTPMLRVLEPPPPGVMVQPVLLDYGDVGEELGWIGEESGIDNARRVLGRKGSFALRVHLPRALPSPRLPGPQGDRRRKPPPDRGGADRRAEASIEAFRLCGGCGAVRRLPRRVVIPDLIRDPCAKLRRMLDAAVAYGC